MRYVVLLAVLCAGILTVLPVGAEDRVPEFIPIGDLGGGTFRSVAWAVSGDGEVVVGESISNQGIEAFRWTRADGMVGLGDLPGGSFSSAAYAVDTDGDVIVGSSQSADSAPTGMEAFRWTADGGMKPLGDLPGGFYASAARGVSGSGAVVAGHSTSLASLFQAMRWTSGTGMQPLSDLPTGPNYCTVNAVSRDGTAIIGQGKDDEGSWGVRWDTSGVPTRLAAFTIGVPDPNSNALDCSHDGSFVVGIAQTDVGARAVRFFPDGRIETLGSFGSSAAGPGYSIASACSADATVIVGSATTALGPEAFVWTESKGMRRVTDVLEGLGVSGLDGWRLFQAHGVSDDGRVIVGSGMNPSGQEEGWVAILGDPPEIEPAGLLVTKLTVKVNTSKPAKSSVKVFGQCDQGVWLGNDLTKPLDLKVGDLELATGDLKRASNGRSYRYRGEGIDLKLLPNRRGTSATKFRLTYKGDLGGKVITGGRITVEMRGQWVIAAGTVSLVAGKYSWNRKPGPGALEAPFCHLTKATVKLGSERAKELKLTSCLAPGASLPVTAPPFTIEFRGWKATIPVASFERESWGYRFRGNENGLTRVDLDYMNREAISIEAKDIDLGPFAEGRNSIEVRITMGAITRLMTVRVIRAGKKVHY